MNCEKEIYLPPFLEVVFFESDDIITTSSEDDGVIETPMIPANPRNIWG